ncbi:MAG: hypothetical protein M3O32_01605 [Actinomycetota bacterium]|nr:hypothetical protein [Actinomycetota bacterium]
MSVFDQFPSRLPTGITPEDLAAYLIEQQGRGYQVTKDGGALTLDLDGSWSVRFSGHGQGYQVQLHYLRDNIQGFLDVDSMPALRAAVNQYGLRVLGLRWRQPQTTTRLVEAQAATNNVTISRLIGAASVEAIFDPYLTNQGLVRLSEILSFGNGGVAPGLRALATPKTAGGQVPRLTRAGFDAWTGQLGIFGEIRVMPPSEHRRFLLLTGNESLIIGPSLNAIDKNEAVRLEDGVADRAFFDATWAKATPFP